MNKQVDEKVKNSRILYNSRGVTLTEMLVAMLILSLATTVITQCVMVATRHFISQTRESEAQMLCASLVTAIQDELTYAENIEPDADGGFTYFSKKRSLGSDASLCAVNNKIYIKNSKAYIQDGSTFLYPLVEDESYTAAGRKGNVGGAGDFLRAGFSSDPENAGHPTWDAATGLVSVDLYIFDRDGNTLSYAEFSVMPIAP